MASVLVVLLGAVTSTAAAAPGTIAIPACAHGPCVVVEVIGADGTVRQQQEFDAAAIVGADADVEDESYPIKGGTAASVKPGSSVHRLIDVVLGSDAGSATYADVVWDDAYQRHLLTGRELGDGAAAGFQGGLVPAFYSTDPGSPQRLNYIRPQRDADDANGAPGPDQGTRFTDAGGAFLVRVHLSGRVLAPQATATPTDATHRTYTLSTDQSGSGHTFDWVLPDGTRSTEASPVFTFPAGSQAGTYPATVGVSADDGSFGWGTVQVRAGDPPAPTPSASATGPGGVASATAGPTKKPSATRSAEPNPTATGTAAPAPTAASTAAPTGDATGMATLAPPPGPVEPPSASPTSSAAAPEQSGEAVTGVVLAGASAAGSSSSISADPPASPSAAPLGEEPLQVATAVWVVGGIAALLLVGASSESERVRRRLRRPCGSRA